MSVLKRIVSKITLMRFVDTMVLCHLLILLGVCYHSIYNEFEKLQMAYTDIKHSKLKDQETISKLEDEIVSQKIAMVKQQQIINDLDQQVKQLVNIRVKNREFIFNVSAYTASRDETDSDPTKTAFMTKPKVGKTVAVSRDLVKKLKHKRVYIEDVGIRVVEDVMNPRYRNSMDLLVKTKREARDFGRKDIRVVLLD